MTISKQIEQIEAAIAKVGVSVEALCASAGINRSTWTRWKSGNNTPNMETWGRVQQAFDRLVAGSEAA